MLGCFNPNLGQIWTNPNAPLKEKVEGISVLTQNLGLSIFYPNLG